MCRNGTDPKILLGIYIAFHKWISICSFSEFLEPREIKNNSFLSDLIKKRITDMPTDGITVTAGDTALSSIKSSQLSHCLRLLANCRFCAGCWGCQGSGGTKIRKTRKFTAS